MFNIVILYFWCNLRRRLEEIGYGRFWFFYYDIFINSFISKNTYKAKVLLANAIADVFASTIMSISISSFDDILAFAFGNILAYLSANALFCIFAKTVTYTSTNTFSGVFDSIFNIVLTYVFTINLTKSRYNCDWNTCNSAFINIIAKKRCSFDGNSTGIFVGRKYSSSVTKRSK